MIIDIPVIITLNPSPPTSLGILTFNASLDHDNVDYYEARLHPQGSPGTLLATLNLGKPDPNPAGVIFYDIASWLSGQTPANYSVTVAAVNTSGSTESLASNDFTVPLS